MLDLPTLTKLLTENSQRLLTLETEPNGLVRATFAPPAEAVLDGPKSTPLPPGDYPPDVTSLNELEGLREKARNYDAIMGLV